jgi:hypothetical protein
MVPAVGVPLRTLAALVACLFSSSIFAQSDDLARAKQTSLSILEVATAWEAFASDHNSYLPTTVAEGLTSRGKGPGDEIRWSNYIEVSHEALRKALVPTYIRSLPQTDAWGHPLQFAVHIENSKAVDYVIRSTGSDRSEDDDGKYLPSTTSGFAADIVFSEGEFKVYPSALRQPKTPPLDQLNKLTPSDHVVALLEGSGLAYSKVQDNMWSTEFTGEHAASIKLLIMIVDDTVSAWCKVAGKQRLDLSKDILGALLRFNHDYDGVKVTVDDDTVWIRYDARVRSVDGPEWEYILNQVASGADELVKVLQPALKRTGA